MSERKARAALVYNPVKIDRDAVDSVLTAIESEVGWEPTLWLETSVEDPGQGQARQAREAGVDVVIAAGGDGTVRAVAEALRGSGLPLALLPSGTGNLLARNLDLTLEDLEHSLRVALTGTDRPIDAAVMTLQRDGGARETHTFVVMAGMGLDARMLSETDDDLKKKAGWLAYVSAITRVLRDPNELTFSFRLDGKAPRRVKAYTIMIGNCGSLPGGLLLIPDAKPDDGILDIVAFRPQGPFGWLRVWNKIAWENGVLRKTAVGRKIIDISKDVKDVTYWTGKDLVIDVAKPQEFQLDGDEFGEATHVHTWVDAKSLTVRVPKES